MLENILDTSTCIINLHWFIRFIILRAAEGAVDADDKPVSLEADADVCPIRYLQDCLVMSPEDIAGGVHGVSLDYFGGVSED
jgi:hypothetical protein